MSLIDNTNMLQTVVPHLVHCRWIRSLLWCLWDTLVKLYR